MSLRGIDIFKSFVVLIVCGLSIYGCSKDEPEIQDSGKIKYQNTTQVLQKSIPAGGGLIQIQESGNPISGLELEIPAGSYDQEIDFKVSYAEIISHELGDFFHPVSSLIYIENGGKLANKLMRLRIPVTGSTNTYRMACYYEPISGALEPMPVSNQSNDFIEVAARHFSWIVVTEIQKDLLIQGGAFHTDFDPVVNGWGFENFGTYPSDKGICAGMSIGAAWYHKNFKTSLALNSFFDNDQLWFPTPDIWEDDASGLRYATAIHRVQESFWTLKQNDISLVIQASEEDRFFNLIYSLLIINQPQLIFIDKQGGTVAHMMVAYGYEIQGNDAFLKIYDPNFPDAEKKVRYDLSTHKFDPYVSAENTQAIAQGYFTSFDVVAYIPLSYVMDQASMDFLWQKVQNKTIEDGLFPAYKIFAVPKDQTYNRVEMNTRDNAARNYIPFGEFDFKAEGLDGLKDVELEAFSFLPGFGLERYRPAKTIVMDNRDTLIGIYIKALPPNGKDPSWVGFEWFRIQLQDIWIEPADTVVPVHAEVRFNARNNGTAPVNARYDWDFGDLETATTHDTSVSHTYNKPDEYEVSLKVTNLDNQQEVALVKTKIFVSIWPKMAITLTGDATIYDSEGNVIPSIGWANKYPSYAPALRWINNQFEVEYQYNLGDPVYTCRISGTMDEDFKKIQSLTAIYTGFGFGGDWTYEAAISISDFPVLEYIPKQIIGNELSGLEAKAKVKQLSWKQTYKDLQGQTQQRTLQSIDWTSPKTELSIFFYDR